MVFEKVRAIIADQLDIDGDDIALSSDIQSEFGADSLDIVDMIMSLEDEFEIELPDEEVENMKTVGDVVRFIEDNT